MRASDTILFYAVAEHGSSDGPAVSARAQRTPGVAIHTWRWAKAGREERSTTRSCRHVDTSGTRATLDGVRPDAGRVALVTGASRGLGSAIAARLGADGFAVAVNYARSAATAEEVVARIRDAGSAAEAFQADVTDEAAVGDLVARVRDVLGPVHTLVLNATGTQPAAAVADLTWQAHLDQLEFFVKSPMLLVRAVLGDMTSAGSGRVIHVGSDIVDRALPGSSAYASAKAAQLGLARVWARELAPLGITVNTVAPGWVPVERHDSGREEDRLEYLRRVPLGRMGEPADVAGAVSYLASDDAAFVTGARLVVNGGFSVD
jgi:NAD(P)-dependent dehydrogenase (short-subunit alcohol dehydrogenase family)